MSQLGQVAAAELKLITTRSPGLAAVTALPTSSTIPAPSWPSTTGSGTGSCSSRTAMSVWHTPQATIADAQFVGPQMVERDVLDREGRRCCRGRWRPGHS